MKKLFITPFFVGMLSFFVSIFIFVIFLLIKVHAEVPYDYLYNKYEGIFSTNIEDYPVNNYSLSHFGFERRHLHRSPYPGGHSLYRFGHNYNRSTLRDGQGYHYSVYSYNPSTGCMQFTGQDYYNRFEYWERYGIGGHTDY